jgi:hypothetical protein
MPSPKVINLNDYEKVDTKDELEGYQSIIIIPWMSDDGIQPPAIFVRKGEFKGDYIVDTTDVVWHKEAYISKEGSNEDYAKRVDWWFSEAAKNQEYCALINSTFNKNQFDVKMSVEKARAWVKTHLIPAARKTHMHKYLWNWLVKGMQINLNRIDKQRNYNR